MVKELRIVLDDSEYEILTTQKKAEGLTWKGVLYRAFGLEASPRRGQGRPLKDKVGELVREELNRLKELPELGE